MVYFSYSVQTCFYRNRSNNIMQYSSLQILSYIQVYVLYFLTTKFYEFEGGAMGAKTPPGPLDQ